MAMSENAKKLRGSSWAENVRTIAYALLIALFIRAFLFQPFFIPSSSMESTLLIGDYLFVAKYSYGYSKHSLPFSPPLFSGRIFDDEPERGDIVVFKQPIDNHTDFIKRVIGLPGDTVQMKDGVLYLNDKAVPRVRVDDFIYRDPTGNVRRIPQYRETLPNGVSYITLDMIRDSVWDNTGVYIVPQGHYFMMGDNRDNSSDSRVPDAVGYVPFENLIGKAEVIFFSANGTASFWEVWKWPWAVRWDRIGKWVE
ncbi:signal peptidase I [Parvibaculum sp.]|jgi:signal peptidase I|uniref:signal peptidase I n=2 Tax=Parvibaculum sp. TaxID=2024848 RepID=UPI000C3A95FB|nr:signal peptidase I [Parvibaculum sp.]HAC58113.1 signal peptidase I [Rhodobiaceae bacterium]MAU59112.1 signal peptidase I [Parvibaculum sp.]MBO6669369.1 signal peptidase I [Parvibaculum sp.]MBO6692714.1 signal peptidase I [Parvibaculum sp.]MBO6715070.1 signal peptidase I [Parvibaculum sp.]|tara:strand:- start:243 stop:1001 length:759 start_codon:yes stop_codon:yes gene_type:complete